MEGSGIDIEHTGRGARGGQAVTPEMWARREKGVLVGGCGGRPHIPVLEKQGSWILGRVSVSGKVVDADVSCRCVVGSYEVVARRVTLCHLPGLPGLPELPGGRRS